MRLVIATCAVEYQGRLNARLPEATRLLMVKRDGSISIHADDRAYKPLNWMTPPCVLREEPGRWTVTNPKGETLVIDIVTIHADTLHDLGQEPGLAKDGVEADLQELLAANPGEIEPGLRLIRREHPTDIGPVDLLCVDGSGATVAVEIKRHADIDGVEQLDRYLARLDCDVRLRPVRGISSRPRRSSRRRGRWRKHAASGAWWSTTTGSAASGTDPCGCSRRWGNGRRRSGPGPARS